MKKLALPSLALAAVAAGLFSLTASEATPAAGSAADTPLSESLRPGKAEPLSFSALTFAPDGTLFIGDSKGGAVFAVATDEAAREPQPIAMSDVEARIAARLGAQAEDVLVHDLAVHPISHRLFLAVSLARSQWDSGWKLPNHIADANILLTIDLDGSIDEFSLEAVRFARAALKNPVSPEKQHPWIEGLSLRTDTITDMAYTEDTLFVAGLSNEEFSSTLWKIPLPFADGTTATTLEIYHGAHGEYETHAPIRTFVPYELDGTEHILAAYLCTPLSLFKVEDLNDETHLKGRTVAEFGSGNYPLDMVVVHGAESDTVVIANSNLGLIMMDTRKLTEFEGEIDDVLTEYSAGVEHVKRSGTGIQQLDNLADRFLITLQRMPNGKLDLGAMPLRRG